MRPRRGSELPEALRPVLRRARRLEWASLLAQSSIVAVVYWTMGASQTMKAAWVEDLLSFVAPVAFLVSTRVAARRPDQRHPYGFHRAVSIAFLAGAVALTLLGVFILGDSLLGLVRHEHPTIGLASVAGRQVWAGWPMVVALAYSALPPFVLGRLKLPVARELHDKTLKADADMNRADWMTAAAGIVGVLGVGLGWWWADGVAAGVISLDIVRDGVGNLRRVVLELMDRSPTTVEGEPSEVPERVRRAILALDWVAEARVRMREEGHLLTGEAFLVVAEGAVPSPERLRIAVDAGRAVDWRVYDLVCMAVEPSMLREEAPAR